jgi:O-antigen/teichoic acid export membrane protein
MIGAYLGIALVTPFSIARRLQDYAHKVVWTATGVVVPIATHFHARSELRQQQNLLIQGGKYSTVAAIFFVSYFVCLGRVLIGLWMGPAFIYVTSMLIILSVGEFVQMTQSVTGSIILATAQHRMLAIYAVIESIVTIMFLTTAARRFGLVGVSIAVAIPQFVFSGMATLIYGCRVTHVGTARYFREAFAPALMAAAVPVLSLAFFVRWAPPKSWIHLLVYSVLYAAVYAGACWVVLKPTAGGSVMKDVRTAFFSS